MQGGLLPYPPDTIGWQVAIKLTWFGTQYSRLVLSSMGNKLEMRSPLVWLLGLSGVSLLGEIFLISVQTYVLRAESFLFTVALVLTASEAVLALYTVFQIQNEHLKPF